MRIVIELYKGRINWIRTDEKCEVLIVSDNPGDLEESVQLMDHNRSWPMPLRVFCEEHSPSVAPGAVQKQFAAYEEELEIAEEESKKALQPDTLEEARG